MQVDYVQTQLSSEQALSSSCAPGKCPLPLTTSPSSPPHLLPDPTSDPSSTGVPPRHQPGHQLAQPPVLFNPVKVSGGQHSPWQPQLPSSRVFPSAEASRWIFTASIRCSLPSLTTCLIFPCSGSPSQWHWLFPTFPCLDWSSFGLEIRVLLRVPLASSTRHAWR